MSSQSHSEITRPSCPMFYIQGSQRCWETEKDSFVTFSWILRSFSRNKWEQRLVGQVEHKVDETDRVFVNGRLNPTWKWLKHVVVWFWSGLLQRESKHQLFFFLPPHERFVARWRGNKNAQKTSVSAFERPENIRENPPNQAQDLQWRR